jgi:tetratricopeptide (TPR) repeat protein
LKNLLKKVFGASAAPQRESVGDVRQMDGPSAESGDWKKQGDALLARDDLDAAAKCYEKAIALYPHYADAYLNLGYILKEQRRFPEATQKLEHAVSIDPELADAYYLLGLIAWEQSDPPRAAELLGKAVAAKPDFLPAYLDLCQIHLHGGNTDLAKATASKGIERLPHSTELHCYLGRLYEKDKQPEQAARCFKRALALEPDDPDVHADLGNALHAMGQPEQAVASFRQAISLRPGFFDALFKCGNALMELKRCDEALASYEECVRLDPDNAPAFSNRGAALKGLGRLEEALVSFDRAIHLDPQYCDPVFNRGTLMGALRRYDEALECYAQALQLCSEEERGKIEFHESACHLLLGRFEVGWKKYEARWESGTQKKRKRHFPQPLWLGQQSLAGKTILLHAEQGFGDTIQFCRYARLVADLGAKVLLGVPPELEELIAGVDGVHGMHLAGQPIPEFDYHCPMMSLPLALGTLLDSIPAPQRYIGADPLRTASWRTRLGQGAAPRAGLVWSGNPDHANDKNRSIPFEELAGIRTEEWQFVSIQKAVRPEDAKVLDGCPEILQLGQQLADYSDTAALIANLDLVISVDTSVVHLAGAMGKPVWLMLPFNPDWRWMLDRADSPWYPSMRIFRQSKIGDWSEVIAAVRRALQDWTPPSN